METETLFVRTLFIVDGRHIDVDLPEGLISGYFETRRRPPRCVLRQVLRGRRYSDILVEIASPSAPREQET